MLRTEKACFAASAPNRNTVDIATGRHDKCGITDLIVMQWQFQILSKEEKSMFAKQQTVTKLHLIAKSLCP